MQKEARGCVSESCKDGGVLPDYRVPTGRRHGKRGTCKDLSRTRCKHTVHLRHMHSVMSGRHLRIIPLKRAFRGGSKSSREVVVHVATVVVHIVVEVVVHVATVVEVDVHGSSWEVVVLVAVVEVVVHGHGSCTHVVVELDGTNVLEGSRGTWGLRTCRSWFLRR